MPSPTILFTDTAAKLAPAPINPKWILDGTPVARNALLSKSADGTASTLLWDCSEGAFNWFYDTDETIHILEGSVVLSDHKGPTRRIGPGDVVFFPAGSSARWQVEGYVRKLAFFRVAVPKPVGLALRAWRRLTLFLRPTTDSGAARGAAPAPSSIPVPDTARV